MIFNSCPVRVVTGTAAVLNSGFCGFPHYLNTYVPSWRRKRREECSCFKLFSLLFVTSIHSTSELLTTPFNRLEMLYFYALPPFFCPSSFLIIYPIQFALFSLLLCGSLRAILHFPPFLHSFCSLRCDRFIASSKASSPARGI